MLEQLVAETCRIVESIGRHDLRRDDELPRTDEGLKPNRIVLEGPGEAHPLGELRKPIPTQRADPGSPKPLDQTAQVEVRREVGLQDRDAGVLGPEVPGTQDTDRPRCDPITQFRVLDQVVVGETMESARQLLGMDPETSPQPLESNLGGRILGEKFEDLSVVLPQVERGGFDARFSAFGYHRPLARTSATDKSASPRIAREKGNGGGDAAAALQAANVPF
jgi:hypothetical protein